MSGRRDVVHVEVSPHFDGEKEDILNDPTATADSQMGLQVDMAQEGQPLDYHPKQDKELQQFEKLMRGKKLGN